MILTRNVSVLYVDHIQGKGEELFRLACREDLEGIVAKWVHGLYHAQGVSSWIKIKKTAHTQIAGREELFERKRLNGTGASRLELLQYEKQRLGAELGRVTEALEALNSLEWERAQTRQSWEGTTRAMSNAECSGKSPDRSGSESKVS